MIELAQGVVGALVIMGFVFLAFYVGHTTLQEGPTGLSEGLQRPIDPTEAQVARQLHEASLARFDEALNPTPEGRTENEETRPLEQDTGFAASIRRSMELHRYIAELEAQQRQRHLAHTLNPARYPCSCEKCRG